MDSFRESENSTFNTLVNLIKTNKEKPLMSWLTLTKIFKKGKQGIAGLLKTKDGLQVVFKLSLYINYLGEHENMVATEINKLYPFSIHFGRTVGIVRCKIDPRYRTVSNPFLIKGKYPLTCDVVMYEYIQKSFKLYNHIRNQKLPENKVFSTIKQVLHAINIAQNKIDFVHYDLHSNNIMLRKCDPNLVVLYALSPTNIHYVPTYGKYPVIIDYGYSFVNTAIGSPAWASMSFTDVGFTSDRFDWCADPRLFLLTIATDLEEHNYDSVTIKRLVRIIRNMFSGMKVESDSGWDLDSTNACQYVVDMVEGYTLDSYLFYQYHPYCVDIIQTLETLPFSEQDYSNIVSPFSAFIKEWVKIETENSSPFYNMYVLKKLVDSARTVKTLYTNPETREEAVRQFIADIHSALTEVSQFCQPKGVNYELLLCSLFLYARCIGGVFHDVISAKMTRKNRQKDNLPVQSVLNIIDAIEINFPDDYTFTKDTIVLVQNTFDETIKIAKIDTDERAVRINQYPPSKRAMYIYREFA